MNAIQSIRLWLRQPYRKDRAASCVRVIGGGDGSAVCGDNFIGDGQSKPEVVFIASGFFAAVKAFEDTGFVVVADTDTGVIDSERKMSARVFAIAEGGGDATVFGGIADGVMQQDCERLRDTLRVTAAGRDGSVREDYGQADIFFGGKTLEGFAGI